MDKLEYGWWERKRGNVMIPPYVGDKRNYTLTLEELEKYRAQVAAYEAQLKAHTAEFFAKQQETNPMPPNKVLFSVHIATNGYYAVSDSGITVVSTTLSEVCTAMQAALADEAARSDTDAVVKAMYNWQKVT